MADKQKSEDVKQRLNEGVEFNRSLLMRVVANSVLQSRASYGNTQTFDGARDVYTALGYPAIDKIKYSDFLNKYKRQDIAAAIIDKPVYGAWKKRPVVRADDVNDTKFEESFDKLAKELRLFDVFQRVDKLAGIGQYAVLYVGVKDGASSQAQPLGRGDVLYVQPYGQDNAPIDSLVTDRTSQRFAMPDKYGLRTVKFVGGVVEASAYTEEKIDASRVIHVADNILENNIYGMSRLEKVYNRLLNLELVVGGSAEMFWQGAFPGLAFSVKDNFDLTPQDKSDLEDEIQKYVHQLERYMKLQGLDVETLSSQVADPSSHVDVSLKMISIATGIPKRILEGSERGELASSQDTKAWNEYLDNRRKTFCEPSIMRPTIDKFIEVGALEEPKGGYVIEWPDLDTVSDKDKAEVGKIRGETLRGYASTPDAQLILPPDVFFKDVMGFDDDVAERILESAEGFVSDALEQEADGDEFEDVDMDLLENEWGGSK